MNIENIKSKLQTLDLNAEPEFGTMTPQHMIEHLILTVKLSYGRIKIPHFEPTEKQLQQKKTLLYELDEFPKGIRAPGLGNNLLPLRFQSLKEANNELLESLEKYKEHFEEQPNSTPIHPRFGVLNKSEWDLFHTKHFKHHFSQFGL